MKYTILFFISLIFLLSCASSPYEELPSYNSNFRVKTLIMHYTAVDYATSVKYLVNRDGLSSHYLVPESNDPSYPYDELKIMQLVDENERAWHAGVSYWQGRTSLNDTSIGIEIVNVPTCTQRENQYLKAEHGEGRLCSFPDFDPKQISLVIELSKGILERNPDIEPTAVIAHSDIAPSRKNDPGPRFPWYQLYREGIGAWYDTGTLASYWQLFSRKAVSVGLLQEALHTYGYGIKQTGVMDQQTIDVISAFQMHFLPWQVNGRNDDSTAAAVFALIEKYFPERLDSLMQRLELENNQPKRSLIVSNGQIDRWFTSTQNVSSFFAYQNTGEIRISAVEPTRADIYINGEKLLLTDAFTETPVTYSLGKRTHDGLNSLSIDNIQPNGADLHIQIDHPVIQTAVSKSKPFNFSKTNGFIESVFSANQHTAELIILYRGNVVEKATFGVEASSDNPLQFSLGQSSHLFASNLAVMHLVEQGAIDVDEPVYTYLPEYRGQGRDLVTVEDLLMHTSGYEESITDYLAFDEEELERMLNDKAFVRDLVINKLPAERGETSSFSEINELILSFIVKRVSGLSVFDYANTFIYQPLELTKTSLYSMSSQNERMQSIDSLFTGLRAFSESNLTTIQSSANDIAILSQLMLNQGGYGFVSVFGKSTYERFIKPDSQVNHQVLGWQVNRFEKTPPLFGHKASRSAYGHSSENHLLVIDPDIDLSVIFLSDRINSNDDVMRLVDLIYTDLISNL